MQDILERARHYWRAAGVTGLGHYKAAERAGRRHRSIGIPSVALSAIVATSVFSTLSESVAVGWRIATGVIALVAAILAALQAFLNLGDIAEKHKAAGARYGKVRRSIDLFLLQFGGTPPGDRADALAQLEVLAEELGTLAQDSPSLAGQIYDAAKAEFTAGHVAPAAGGRPSDHPH